MSVLDQDAADAANKIARLQSLAAQFSEAEAWRRPGPDGWCLMEVLSHIIGPEEESSLAGINRALLEDTPQLALQAGASCLHPRRLGLSKASLLREAVDSLETLAALGRSLSPAQAARSLRIPWLAGTPLGETPLIGEWLGGLLTFHLDDHIAQIETLSRELEAMGEAA